MIDDRMLKQYNTLESVVIYIIHICTCIRTKAMAKIVWYELISSDQLGNRFLWLCAVCWSS